MEYKANESEYRLKFFIDSNYIRHICKSCKTPFWTKDPNRDLCADIPCTDYYFFSLDIKTQPLSVREARNKFLHFFERKGHTIIKPKPVLARWREDLYLTIASIVDFQPHVTSGLVKPPANPLVISQPCIRLEDVDNVGITFGRHLTSFEMAAHHAFNYPDQYIYWKDETVELAKEFFTREIGIPEDQLNFKESWWEGGGNAGPSFEVTVGGLELATLVFMQYSISNGAYVPLKLKIVDTGYGVERIAWFTQKTPTAFHAIYGNLVDVFFDKLGIPKIDTELLKVASRYAGKIDPEKPETMKIHRLTVAQVLGKDINYVDSELTRASRVFQVLDHTKTIALMLADGLVPSNSGEGYLGRLLIRRVLRVLRLLNSDIKLSELIKYQIDYWGEDFPELVKNKDYILEITDLERDKFSELVSKLPSVVSTVLRKKSVNIDDLIQIYDSYGIPPDLINEELKRENKPLIDVPSNFYSLVAKRHQVAPIKPVKRSKIPEDVQSEVKSLSPTRKLYYEDQYLREFTGKVIYNKSKYLVLDKTAFYPEGGGQLGDTGKIIVNGQEIRVVDTQKVGDVVVHILDKDANLEKGTEVKGIIDWERRYRLMRHHTGTHVVLQAAKRLLGEHIWQAGAEKTPEKARLDITHYRMLTSEEINKLEDMANYVINDSRPVRALLMDRMEAEMKYGVSIYEGGVPESKDIRILEIKDWDIESCGGTHVKNTNEIGAIKIINVEKIQDGVIRLEFVAGPAITDYSRSLEAQINEVSNILGTPSAQLQNRVRKLIEEHDELKMQLNEYRKYVMDTLVSNLKYETVNGYTLYPLGELFDEDLMKEIMRKLTAKEKVITIGIVKGEVQRLYIATSRDIKVEDFNDVIRNLGGKGGGKGTFGSWTIFNVKLEDILNGIKKRISGSL